MYWCGLIRIGRWGWYEIGKGGEEDLVGLIELGASRGRLSLVSSSLVAVADSAFDFGYGRDPYSDPSIEIGVGAVGTY
jgi:hypothetical protein